MPKFSWVGGEDEGLATAEELPTWHCRRGGPVQCTRGLSPALATRCCRLERQSRVAGTGGTGEDQVQGGIERGRLEEGVEEQVAAFFAVDTAEKEEKTPVLEVGGRR